MKTEINLEDFKDYFNGQFQRQIKDEPNNGLIRILDYYGANISKRFKEIKHDCETLYFTKEGAFVYKEKTQQRDREWKVDNSYEVIERNEDGTPKLDAEGEMTKHPAFDYFIEVVYNIQAPLKTIIISSIDLDDYNNLFDK